MEDCRRSLVGPYCALPRDYLSDTPYCVLWACKCLNMAKLGAIPLALACAQGAIPTVQEGYLSDTCARPHEQRHFYANKAKTEMPPLVSETLQNEMHACKTR